jgi:hypothetical protein
MSSTRRPKYGAFFEFTSVSEARWAQLMGLIALAYRPPNRSSDSFADHGLIPLTGATLFVMRWQHSLWPGGDKPQRSVILMAFKFAFDVHSSRVYVDAKRNAECNPAVYDCALPRNLWSACLHHLDPARNRTAVDLAIAMAKEGNRVIEAGEPVPHQPALPEFYLAFGRPPVFERSTALRREASAALGKVADDVTDAELEAHFWSRSFQSDNYTCVPQRYLAHQGLYPVHPVDGSLRPDGEGKAGEWRGQWYFGDGRWNPAAQRADWPLAYMAGVLGRPYRNPAFTVLKANSFFPAELTYPQFMAGEAMAGFQQRLTAAVDANGTVIDVLVAGMRKQLGGANALATDDDLKNGLASPERPLSLSFATGIRLVRYTGLPRSEAFTWQFEGCDVDLFAAKSVAWAGRTAPVEVRPEGSLNHGRAPAPVVD